MDEFDRDKAIFSTRAGKKRRRAPVPVPAEVDDERTTPGGFGFDDRDGRTPPGASDAGAFGGDFRDDSSGASGGLPGGLPGALPNDGWPEPVVTPESRTHPLSIAALLFALLCPGPGTILALICAFLAFRQIRLGDGKWDGDGMAKAAVAISLLELIFIGVMLAHLRSRFQEMEALEVEAAQFLHDFTRYQEDESFADKARARMSQGLRVALMRPQDERLSFEIADTLGPFEAFQSCPSSTITTPREGAPSVFTLNCTATFAPNGPPVAVTMFFVPEGDPEVWRVVGFTLKSPLHARPITVEGPILRTVKLSDYSPRR